MVIEYIPETNELHEIEPEESKLVAVCRLCNENFTPSPYECPYLYNKELGLHIPLCGKCRAELRREASEND